MVHPAFTFTECAISLRSCCGWATRTRSPYASENGVADVPCADNCAAAVERMLVEKSQAARTESGKLLLQRARQVSVDNDHLRPKQLQRHLQLRRSTGSAATVSPTGRCLLAQRGQKHAKDSSDRV